MAIIFENEDLLRENVETSFRVPEHVLSFSEAALYLTESINDTFSALFESIGVHELAVYEATGAEIVYEAEEKQNLVNKVVAGIQQAWAKIKQFFTDILTKINTSVAEAKKNLIKVDVNNLNGDIKFGKIHDFEKVDAGKYLGGAERVANNIAADTVGKYNNEASIIQSLIDGESAGTIKELRANIRKELVGEPYELTGADLKGNKYYEMYRIVTNAADATKEVKKAYTETRKIVDTCLSTAKKSGVKTYSNGAEAGESNKNYVGAIKSLIQVVNAINGELMDIIKMQRSEYTRVLIKAHNAAGRQGNKTEKSVQKGVKKMEKAEAKAAKQAEKEAAKSKKEEVQESYVAMVENAFNW